jgi:hypothetical protein
MVVSRYPAVPVIQDFRETIGEAIEAHFFGLNHVAVGGLVPVVEGAGRRIATSCGLPSTDRMGTLFAELADYCKSKWASKQWGDAQEIESMLDSFVHFAKRYLYVNSSKYPLFDKTNRHGILHGAYSDADYGTPVNFYKAIAAVDFLTFVAAVGLPISWFAPDPSPASVKLATYYATLIRTSARRIR